MTDLHELIESAKMITASLDGMATRWKADADQYQKQVDEARAKNLPHDQMLSMMVCLRACAKEVEREWIMLAVAYNKPIVMGKVRDILASPNGALCDGTVEHQPTPEAKKL